MNKNKIIVNIYSRGDSLVGLSGEHYTVTINGMNLKTDIEEHFEEGKGRKLFKDDIYKLFSTWLNDNNLDIFLNDECPDCFKKGCKGECNYDDFSEF